MRLLFLGDIVGKPGREALKNNLKDIRRKFGISFVIANGENSAGGSGLTPRIAEELLDYGVDVITSGDHVWKKSEIYDILRTSNSLIRPANYPEGAPGKGSTVIEINDNLKIAVINLLGRVFMDPLDCPFICVKEELESLKEETPVIFVDMHAEATSEKVAMGWFLDGQVSAVIGTHTHIQTADEKILPGGTAYLTDAGMTGSCDSVIGRKKENIIARFLTHLPNRFEVATGGVEIQGVIVDINEESGKATAIERFVKKS